MEEMRAHNSRNATKIMTKATRLRRSKLCHEVCLSFFSPLFFHLLISLHPQRTVHQKSSPTANLSTYTIKYTADRKQCILCNGATIHCFDHQRAIQEECPCHQLQGCLHPSQKGTTYHHNLLFSLNSTPSLLQRCDPRLSLLDLNGQTGN
jgi:hypothetical protein